MGDTSPPQPQLAGKHRTTRQETAEPNFTAPTTTAAPPTSTHGTTASRPSRKDALLSQKHSRSNNSHGHAASSTISTTTNTLATNAGHSNINNKRHSHTVSTSKTRPMMRSVSNPSQHHQEQKQQHPPTAAHSTTTTATTKSERRARTSTEHRKRRPKFVCGDHADEDLSSDQQHQEQLTNSHGAATRIVGGEGEEGGTEAGREMEHDGYHPYHPPRHQHDPYPVSPSRHHISLHQDHHPQSTEAAGEDGGRRGKGSQAVGSQQGNIDLERGPNSQSIPNNSQRPQSSTPPPAPMRATEKEQENKLQPEIATIRLTAPDAMIAPTPTRKESTTKKMNGPFTSSSSSSSAEESDVSVSRAKLTNLTLVGKDEQEQRQQRKQGHRIPKDTTLVSKSKGEGSHDHNNNRETMVQPIVPELVVHSTSTTSTPNLAGGGAATAGAHLQSPQQQHSHPAPGVAAATTSPLQRPSERLTRLLNPSLSTTSLPSLSKTTSQPVVAIVSPNHNHTDSIVDSSDSASSHRKDSSPSQQDAPAPLTAAASAVDLVTKLLNPVATLGRSRSQSSLHSMFTNALSGSPSSSSATTGQPRRHHARHGSAASLAGSVKSNPGSSSTGMGMGMGMGFMTSPPRVSDPNVYLISRFITPASQQQAMLSSSAPKQQAGSLSGSSSTGSLAARWRLPASLRMTSSDRDVPATAAAGGGGSSTATAAAATASGTTPTSPGAASTYSSAEGPTPTHSHSATPLPPHSSFPSSNPSSSPWNPVESMSRTQQKLNLQRDSSYDDLDEQEMTRRGRVHKEMERIQREYKCIRMTSDPVLESMSRCFALHRQQQLEQQSEVQGGEEDMEKKLSRCR